MAGERTLPGLGLKAFWTLGSNGYKPDLDEDIRKLSAVVQGQVLSFVASLPGSPVDGDMHIMTAGSENTHIAIRDNGAWAYYTPAEGWSFWSVADAAHYHFDGAAWVASAIDPADFQLRSEKGAVNGYASLNSAGVVPASQLSDDVEEYANLAAFPGTGVEGIIYIALDSDISYLWDGDSSTYIAQGSSTTSLSLMNMPTVGFKQPVRRVAVANVDIATGGVVLIDGGNTANKDRILLAGQTLPAENGIYNANSTGAWTRATDANSVAKMRGAVVTVWQGTTYGGSVWQTTFKQGNTLGVSSMVWNRMMTAGNILAAIDTLLGGSGWQSGGGSTDEQIQDAIGAILDATLVYVDGTPVIKRAPITGHISIPDGSNAAVLGSFTKAQLDAAVSDGNVVYAGDIVGLPFMQTIAVSDETTALTTGTNKVRFRMPHAVTLTAVRASVSTAPTGGTLLTVDINKSGATILSTKLTFDASETTTTTAATAAVISNTNIADDAEISIDIDAVGSTIAGAGLKVTLIGVYA